MKFNIFCCFSKKAGEEPKKTVATKPKATVKETKPAANEKFIFKPEPVSAGQTAIIQMLETDTKKNSDYAVSLAKDPKVFCSLSPDIKLALAIRISTDGRINETHIDVARIITDLKYENLEAQEETTIETRKRAS